MLSIDIDDRQVLDALQALGERGANPAGALKVIGEYLVESTKRRFETSTGPDGQRWAPNTETTFLNYLGRYKGSYTKSGRLSKSGAGRAAGKRPLIGETRSLSTTINYQVSGTELRVGSPMQYAPTHQFGAAKGAYGSFSIVRTRRVVPVPWGDIPARPFLGLSDDDRRFVLEVLQDHLRAEF